MRKSIWLCLVIFCAMSCKKVFLGDEAANLPEENFEIFWTDFDEHYGLFKARGWDWDSIYQVYRPQVTNETTDQELWNIFMEMITYLDDSHTFIYDPDGDAFFASGSEDDDQVFSEFSLDLVEEDYLDTSVNLNLTDDEDESYRYGKVKGKDIGYIYLSDIGADDEDFMDGVLDEIGQHKAIIFDIRNNTGGDDDIGASMAKYFADEIKLVYTVEIRNGPGPDDFEEKVEFYSATVANGFDKPVIMLTDLVTVSAAETFLMHMNKFEQVTQIGDVTAGDFSDTGMRRFLPNGWQYQYSIMMYLEPDGTSLDGIGHIPDVYVRNSVADIEARNDKVMQEAIDYLFEVYGIE